MKNSKYILAGMSAFCLVLITATSIKSSFLMPLRTGVGFVLVPLQSGVNAIGTGLYNTLENFSSLREAQEETSISCVRPLSEAPLSLEILPVAPHFKRGKFVCAHVHLNVTYLLEADPALPLRVKPDENSGVRWFPVEEVLGAVSEPCMRVVYRKLMEKAADFS